jgi:TPP-dependent 2-oxoacid decarboxylase
MKIGDKVISINNKTYQIEDIICDDVGDIYYRINGYNYCATGIDVSGFPSFKKFFISLKQDRKNKLSKLNKIISKN